MTEFFNEQTDAETEEVVAAEVEEVDWQIASERNKRANVAWAIRHYAKQRREGHIPYPGDGWKYKNRGRS